MLADVIASMGPRLLSRGVMWASETSHLNCWLQWGRGFSAAESIMS